MSVDNRRWTTCLKIIIIIKEREGYNHFITQIQRRPNMYEFLMYRSITQHIWMHVYRYLIKHEEDLAETSSSQDNRELQCVSIPFLKKTPRSEHTRSST